MSSPTRTQLGWSRARSALSVAVAALLVLTLAPASPAAAQQAGIAISPTRGGNTAVRFDQTVGASGTVGDGALTAARLIGVFADGSQGFQRIDSSVLGAQDQPVTGGDFLRVDGGELDGRLTLACLFAPPPSRGTCGDRAGSTAETRQVLLEVVVGGRTLVSPPLRVDYVRPRFRDAALTATRTIVARFTEPVRSSDGQPGAPVDYEVRVGGAVVPVAAVTGPTQDDCVGGYGPGEDASAGPTGCTRTLTLGVDVDEDAVPTVDYVRPESRLPSEGLEDFADNRLFDIGTGTRDALDRIRPPLPTITAVDGREPAARVDGRSSEPVLQVSNLRAGHTAVVERVPDEGEPVTGPPTTATSDSATVTSPPLSDGAHLLRVVVRDPNGNLSTDSAKATARSDGGPSQVTYVRDSIRPVIGGALAEDGAVRVLFSEAVAGPDDPADFNVRVDGQDREVTAVEGSGDSRLLTVSGGAPAGARLDYLPGGRRYSDPAGNTVPDAVDLLVAGVAAPVVDIPRGEVFTSAGQAAVGGSVPGEPGSGAVVEIYRDADRNGAPEGDPLATAAVDGDRRWGAEIPLLQDRRNELVVRARDSAGRLSPFTAVPTIVQDAVAPALDLRRPVGGEVLAGGRSTSVQWTTSDTNPGTVLVELSTDGISFRAAARVPAAASGDQSVDVPLPDVDTAAARVRLTSTDKAGNPTVDVSQPFTIDALRPVFTGVTTTFGGSPTDVRLTFSEPVSGPIAPGDFTVNGQPTSVVSVDGPGSTPTLARGATTILLRTAPAFGPDAEPTVSYAPQPTGELTDRAGQGIEQRFRAVDAADGIRPPTPRIDAVQDARPAGENRVAGNTVQPSLTVSNVTAGHQVFVERLPADGGADPGPETTATGSTATVQGPALPDDGDHLLRVVVRDLNGNLSVEDKPESPADAGPSQVTYALDTVVPQLLAATSAPDDATRVTVLFSELLSGTNDPGHWSVPGRTVTDVGGQDRQNTRVLTVTGGPLAGLTLTYRPGDYSDGAGNRVPQRTVIIDGVPAPVVSVPGGPLFTSAGTTTVGGTLSSTPTEGTVVEVLRDEDRNGTGDTVLASDTVDQGAWEAAVPLLTDQVNRLFVQARDRSNSTSPQVPVPAITQDSTAPVLDLERPNGGEILVGGGSSTVEYATSDANRRSLLVELSTNGADFSRIALLQPPADGSGSVPFTVPDVNTDDALVRLTATDKAGNVRQDVSAAPFVIDALAPTFAAATNTFQGTPREVRLTFSEPVSGRLNALTDFRVDGTPAAVFTEAGAPAPPQVDGLRTLVLRTPENFGPDGTPEVAYTPTALGQLVDRAGQGIEARVVTAVDAIRPPTPRIEQVQGRAPDGNDRVVGSAAQPSLTVSNVSEGHTVVVRRLASSGGAVDGGSARATGSTVTVPAPGLPADGEHVLTVLVTDPAGNVSNDGTKNPAPADRGPSTVRYVLDRLVPSLLTASVEDGSLVARFSEAVSGTNDPRHWRVVTPDGQDRPVTAVEGSGSSRTLTVDGGTPGGSRLTYAPASGRYVDVAGNAVPDASVLVTGLPGPVVLQPATDIFVTTPSTQIRGTDVGGSTVFLHRDDDNDGRPDGEPVASDTTSGSDAAWEFTVQLREAAVNRFVVVAQRSDGSRSDHVRVPSITHDDVAPVLDVRGLPGDAQVRRPGSAYEFVWRTCDANLGATPMTFEFTLDGGATWSRFGQERYASANNCDVENRRPVTLPGVDSRDVRLRVTSTDLSGRTATVTSPRFVLDGPTEVRDVRRFACPADQVRPAGFTDTATSTFRFEIDCLAAYRFTKGVTADRYDPAGTVTRAQMALFVARVAGYAGVPLDTADAGFTDMGGRSQETRDAVNALANLRVVEGVGGGRYAPGDPVSRGQMASFLARVQRQVGAPFTLRRNAFNDDNGTTHEANIDLIAAAGVVQGVRPGEYQPLASITRQQMAGFLIRYVDGQIEAGEMRSAY